MALISSSYSFPPGLSGVLPINVPPHMPYSSTAGGAAATAGAAAAMAAPAWMRVPLHYSFPGFSPASLSAAAYLASSPRVRRIGAGENGNHEFVMSAIPSGLSLSKRLAFSPPSSSRRRRRRVTNFTIEGILGHNKKEEVDEDADEDDDHEQQDLKVLVVDTNSSSEPMSPASPSCLKDDRHLTSPPHHLFSSDQHHQVHETSENGLEDHREDDGNNPMTRFSWLQCTRYKPPRLPRAKRKEGAKKRKLGRNPRVPFSPGQVAALEQKFRCTHYLSSIDVAELSASLNLSENRVKIWFQNRRARERRDKEAADKGEVVTSSNLRSPTTAMSIASSPSLIPSPHHHTNSMIASTSATLLSLSANGMPRLSASSPVGMSAFTPVSLSYDLKSATAAAVLSSMHHQQQSHQNQNNL